jgi:diaminohydroxyphosphoribosylaminopyrimidine deaminase/5-amino-6-(5-phosphoribosylamino)uracil reductase
MSDPFPQVAGRGLERLRQAGLQVAVGLMEAEARRLNAPFIKLHTVGRPYVIAKWAMTLDGRLAAPSGDARWISSPQSRQWVHTLRSRMDAILIGAGTALQDDPLLTVRLEAGATDYGRRPARIVLDDQLQLPLGSQLAATAGQAPLIVVTRLDADAARAKELQQRGAEVLRVAEGHAGLALEPLLEQLARRSMTNILVEGGRHVLASFFAEHQVDRLAVFIAPKLVGGEPRDAPAGPPGLKLMNEALPLLRPTVALIGDDVLIEGVLRDY